MEMLLTFPLAIAKNLTMSLYVCVTNSVILNTKTKIMQKSVLQGHKIGLRGLLKTLLIMKLAIVIVLFTAFQVKAYPSLGQYISLSMNNTEIKGHE